MAKFTVTHEIDCDSDTFWRVFLDRGFNEQLFREALGYPAYDVVEQQATGAETTRKVVARPKLNMPAPILKVLGSDFRYTEEGQLDQNVWRWKITPNTLADKIRCEGILRLGPISDSKVRWIYEIELEARVFGIGGLMESSGEKQAREDLDRSAAFMNAWLASHE